MREIHFYAGIKEETISENILTDVIISYADTKQAIEDKQEEIHTTQLVLLSFDLIDAGYDIYVHCNGRTIKMYPGMASTNNKEIRRHHNIRTLLLGGYFDSDFDYIF